MNWRSKKFLDNCYQNIRDAGIPDHIKWIKAAASTRPWMDTFRVGIMGCSAGSQNAVAALLFHNDSGFYRAATAENGCYDDVMSSPNWNERWVASVYEKSSNIVYAAKLDKPLLLLVGEKDDTVELNASFFLQEALKKVNKGRLCKLVAFPHSGHFLPPEAFAHELKFFREHLSGRESRIQNGIWRLVTLDSGTSTWIPVGEAVEEEINYWLEISRAIDDWFFISLPPLAKQPGFLRRIWAHEISFFVRNPELG